jgi:hypothetical protein
MQNLTRWGGALMELAQVPGVDSTNLMDGEHFIISPIDRCMQFSDLLVSLKVCLGGRMKLCCSKDGDSRW